MNNDDGGWGCVVLGLIFTTILVLVGIRWFDDWFAIQAHKAEASLRAAEAERAWAEAEREQAEAVRDVTKSVRSRALMADLLPCLPPIALGLVLGPFIWKVLDHLFPPRTVRRGKTGR